MSSKLVTIRQPNSSGSTATQVTALERYYSPIELGEL
jgi:hypothetical protein